MNKQFGYIRKEVEELIGMSARKIQFYTDLGLVIPDVDNPSGRGTTRRYSRRNMFQLLLVQELVRNGVSLENIKTLFISYWVRLQGRESNFWDYEQDAPRMDVIVIYNPADGKSLTALAMKIKEDKRQFTLKLEFNSALIINLNPLVARLPRA